METLTYCDIMGPCTLFPSMSGAGAGAAAGRTPEDPEGQGEPKSFLPPSRRYGPAAFNS